jgi:hypothetical protein
MTPRADTLLWISLIAMGMAVSVSAKKPAGDGKDKDAPPTLNVQINEAAVRTSPSFLAEVTSTLGYGESVGVLEKNEDWRLVQAAQAPAEGWMHISALTKTKIKLDAGEDDANVRASKEEQAAGGRGFNQEIEDKFRENNEELEAAYRLLDRVTQDPARRASRAEILRFMREGGLTKENGGAP